MGLSLFAVNEGYLDDVPVNKVVAFEAALLSHFRANYASELEGLNANPDYNEDVEAMLRKVVDSFVASGAY